MSDRRNVTRPEIMAAMTEDEQVALREYSRRSVSGEPQDEATRAGMAAYQRTRRSLIPGLAEQSAAAARRWREARTPEQREADRLAHNARQRDRYWRKKEGRDV